MKNLFFLIIACTCGSTWVSAQPAVADPAAPVSDVLYRSVFADTPTGVETESIDWKAANREVGQFTNGHVDILKWEAAQGKKNSVSPMPMPMHQSAPAPATGSGTVKP